MKNISGLYRIIRLILIDLFVCFFFFSRLQILWNYGFDLIDFVNHLLSSFSSSCWNYGFDLIDLDGWVLNLINVLVDQSLCFWFVMWGVVWVFNVLRSMIFYNRYINNLGLWLLPFLVLEFPVIGVSHGVILGPICLRSSLLFRFDLIWTLNKWLHFWMIKELIE